METAIIRLVDGAAGIYVPQRFVSCYSAEEWGIDADCVAILEAGPDHAEYWNAWREALRDAAHTDKSGLVWRLEQDGNLFAVCEEE